MSNMKSPIEYEQTRGCWPRAHLGLPVLTLTWHLSSQGPTSSGKTSLVEYLARRTGHTCVSLSLTVRLHAAVMTCICFSDTSCARVPSGAR